MTSSFDWGRVHARLEAGRASLERAASPGPAEVRRLLKARAAALAVAPVAPRAGKLLELVEFLVAQETWAVESSFVREIRPLRGLTALPGTPPFVLGITAVRGEILSVVDLGRFFDLPARGLTELNRVVVLASGSMTFGILADAILGLSSIPLEEIQTSLPTLTGIREAYVRGITPGGKVVLDGAKLAASEHILVRDYVGVAGESGREPNKESRP